MDNNTTSINIPFPDATELHLIVRVGACRLAVMPGTRTDAWITGAYSEPSGALPLKITQEGSTARITQEPIPSEFWNMWNNPPRLTLRLGTARPYHLTLEGGASESEFDLGGLPLTELNIRQGAGKMDFDFSVPNPHKTERDCAPAASAARTSGVVSPIIRQFSIGTFRVLAA